MTSPRLLKGRTSLPGAFYAITTVASRRRPLFRDSLLARIIIREIRRCDEEGRSASVAWIVMPDHLHWLLRLDEDSLGACLQAFKSRSARAINLARGTQGAVWQAGYYDHRLRAAEDLEQQARYLIGNPLRSGLVDDVDAYPHWWCRWITRAADL